jgi:opacity protein-like surface antigen
VGVLDIDEPARLPTLLVDYCQPEFPLTGPSEALPLADAPATVAPPSYESCASCADEVALPHACRACDRWYVSLSGGTASRETVHEIADARTFIEFDTGFAANLALGYRFDVFRVEAEYSFMNNDCTQAGAGGLASDTVGNVNLRALMFNLYHDMQISDWLWSPYVGAGIGVYQSEINGLYPDFFNTIGAPFAGVPVNATSDIPLAYQFRVGASRPIGERTDFFAGYRYFHGETLTFASAPFASFAPTFSPDGAAMHNVEFGLRVRF